MAEFEDQMGSLLSNPKAMAQIMQLAQSLGGPMPSSAEPAPPQEPPPPASTAPPFGAVSGGGDLLSSLTGGMDPALMLKLLPLVQELGGRQDSNARQLLYALRPYLKPERQEKVERALQLARLFRIGKRVLKEWEGFGHV